MEPKALLDTVAKRYVRYLHTTFFIRDPELRNAFREALSRQSLAKGPFLEITPRFRTGGTLKEVLADAFPGEYWEEDFLRALNGDRPLYYHQETAIRALLRGRNAVVATGTGSGKTETFLLPILIELYRRFRDGRQGPPGVKALILYPMNALVADQRERLGQIARALEQSGTPFRFTFGQYIGATPDSESDRYREPYPLFPGELGTRQAMQAAPPDILITNYSMLEYLLIRPDDSPLFDGGRSQAWQFLVLDEAHQYRGAKGMEMAMLVRRLKDRLRLGGRRDRFTCIATSASLGGPDQTTRAAVAQFATTLFDEPFDDQDVVFGVTEPVTFEDEEAGPPGRYAEYLDALAQRALDPAELFERLRRDRRVARLARRLSDGPRPMADVARDVFPESDPEAAVDRLDELARAAVSARPRDGQLPLLPLRYHFFLRSLEGLRLTYEPGVKAHLVGVERPEAGAVKSFDVALCRHCGQHYIRGRVTDFRLEAPVVDPGHQDFLPTYYRPLTEVMTRERAVRRLKAPAPDDEEALGTDALVLCVTCGAVGAADVPSCGHETLVGIKETEADDEGSLRCDFCGIRGRELIAEVTHGADGPHAVIATALFTHLPPDRRKILAFADSRQRAAFFAWYLGDSYAAIARRNAMLQAVVGRIRQVGDVDLVDAVETYARDLEAAGLADPAAGWGQRLSRGWVDVLQEVLGEDRALSLEATGLLYGRIRLPSWWDPAPLARQWGLEAAEVAEAAQWIWHTMIEDGAAELLPATVGWAELGLERPQKVAVLGQAPRGGVALDSENTKRVRVLARWLARRAGADDARPFRAEAARLVRAIVASVLAAQEHQPFQAHLLVNVGHAGYRVNLRWWRFYAPGETVARCRVCWGLTFWELGDVCPVYRCPGTVEHVPVSELDAEDHHYRRLYREPLPGLLRAEEHTAQIERHQALAYQQDFKNGHIHVLSSSTTFELGVDLGDLDVVFLRNVPPETFNYSQRVGRAGRRPGYPGIAVTFCGRSPHDLYHFEHPERIIRSSGLPPVIRIENERLVLRHWVAVVLSLFFRDAAHRSRFGTVEDFLGDMSRPTVLETLRAFVDQNRPTLDALFGRIIPAPVGRRMSDWVDLALGEESPLALAVAETAADWAHAKALEATSRNQGRYDTASWAQKRARQIAGQDVLGFLSRRVIIPKYGFPVDVVELTLASASKSAEGVVLQRDLSIAIAEFAPTAKVVANKLEWVSEAVKRVPDREWPRYRYRRCLRHGILERHAPGATFRTEPCCGEMYDGEYLVPVFGFASFKDGRRPSRRVERLFATRPFWVGDDEWGLPAISLGRPEAPEIPAVRAYNVRPGHIVVLCEGRRGRGFFICPVCGTGSVDPLRRGHKRPWGGSCTGLAAHPVSLAHEFMTDVLRLDFPAQEGGSVTLAYGLAYALGFSAAELLDVPPSDLSALGFSVQPLSVLLYDNVPGGAGLVSQLIQSDVLRLCILRATERLAGQCGCASNESCYGCLRDYRNQFLHHDLERGPVHAFLSALDAGSLVPL